MRPAIIELLPRIFGVPMFSGGGGGGGGRGPDFAALLITLLAIAIVVAPLLCVVWFIWGVQT